MIVLDRDVHGQKIMDALRKWYPGAVRSIDEYAPPTLADPDIPARLQQAPRDLVFVTNNMRDYWAKMDGQPRYSIICLEVDKESARAVSGLLKRVLQLPPFRIARARNGLVIRAGATTAEYYRRRSDEVSLKITYATGEVKVIRRGGSEHE